MKFPAPLEAFFFRRMPAYGFGLMRISWGLIAGLFFLFQWKDVSYYYAENGIFPHSLEEMFVRGSWRFTILDWVDQPLGVHALYLILLVTLFCTMIGLWPRVMVIVSALLMFSFHERNPFVLGGGDTLLRSIGFIIMISPGIEAFSVHRLQLQWEHWKKHKTFLPPVTMPVWPWRLLLWQMLVLYLTSLWHKLIGTMWLNGTAVAAALHHPVYARMPKSLMDTIAPVTAISTYLTVLWHGLWAFVLIPRWLADLAFPAQLRLPFLRLMMLGGIMFHGGILILMDAGSFSLVVFTAYMGLLREEDLMWMRTFLNTKSSQKNWPITVLYDGHCGLCLRSLFTLQMLDSLKRLRYVDFRDSSARTNEAPGITEETLDKAMHIKLPGDRFLTGFDAFRFMAWHLPVLWPIAPLLYIPGIPQIGRVIYARVAAGRKKCNHENCAI